MTYGGPHSPTIANRWNDGRKFDHLLAAQGILVFRCDPRSATGRGAVSTWIAYEQLGVQETKDLEQAVDWLAQRPYVDAKRIGMSGYSYGGYLTAYVLTHSKKFCAGIAGAPVTDWRNYDAFYTERFMNTPQENPEGYEKSSVTKAAKNLHGRLLLIHGSMDDNVHVQNTLQLAHELQQHEIPFEMMVYPTSRHGIHGNHFQRLNFDFICRTLLSDE
jgi:dipeptidyl aminopeptidase/acylaminoacyl peptidase